MDFSFDTYPQSVRCSTCGRDAIKTVCHHCGRPLCSDHTVEGAGTDADRLTQEFTGLGLEAGATTPRHCVDCAHDMQPPPSWLDWHNGVNRALAGLAVLGILFVALGAEGVGVLFFLGGAAGTAWVWRGRNNQLSAYQAGRPPLPVSSFQDIAVREVIHQDVRLASDGSYKASTGDLEGALWATVSIGEHHRDALQMYKDKYENPPPDVHAGFLVLASGASVRFDEHDPDLESPDEHRSTEHHRDTHSENRTDRSAPARVFPLVAPTDRVAPLHADDVASEWTTNKTYQADLPEGLSTPPILVVPSYVPDVGGQGIDLEIHWPALRQLGVLPATQTPDHMRIRRMSSFQINYPFMWGDLRSANLFALTADTDTPVASSATTGQGSTEDGPLKMIRWQGATFDRSEDELTALRATLMFREPIAEAAEEVPSGETIHGKLELELDAPLSGLDLDVYSPLGDPVEPAIDATTLLRVTFALNLSTLRYQNQVSITSATDLTPECQSSHNGATEGAPTDAPTDAPTAAAAGTDTMERSPQEEAPPTMTFDGTPPNAQTVIALTDTLSESSKNYYVKSVIEEPPRTTGTAGLRNRYWNIYGRWYDGVWPVDFHILLTGVEEVGSGIDHRTGRTEVVLNAKGTYTTPHMKCQIEEAWSNLRRLISMVMRENDTGSRIGAAPTSEPADTQRATGAPSASTPPQRAPSSYSSKADATDPTADESAPPPSPAVEDASTRIRALRQQLDQLRSKLLNDEIDQRLYESMRSDILREMDDIESS